jgi:hypothetical protein
MTRLWLIISLFVTAAAAQRQRTEFPPDIFDTHPVALDPGHFHLILENDYVKVIRVRLGPHEKSMVMEVPGHVITCITDHRVRLIYAHAKPVERSQKAGYTGWVERDEYGLENLDDKPAEWILVVPNADGKSG